MLEGCAARAGLATGELSDVMKIQAQIIGSLIRKAAVEVSLHPARIQGSEAKERGVREHEAKAHLCVDALDPAAVHVCWFVLLSPQVASLGRVAGSDMTWPTP